MLPFQVVPQKRKKATKAENDGTTAAADEKAVADEDAPEVESPKKPKK